MESAPQRIVTLKTRLATLNKKIGNNIKSSIDYQEMLLEYVSNYCKENDLLLNKMEDTHSYINGDYVIQTNIFTVEGRFLKLLKLVYNLEQNNQSGKIISLDFYSKEDLIQKRKRLYVTVYFQNIKPKD